MGHVNGSVHTTSKQHWRICKPANLLSHPVWMVSLVKNVSKWKSVESVPEPFFGSLLAILSACKQNLRSWRSTKCHSDICLFDVGALAVKWNRVLRSGLGVYFCPEFLIPFAETRNACSKDSTVSLKVWALESTSLSETASPSLWPRKT